MKRRTLFPACIMLFVLIGFNQNAKAQISYTTAGSNYTQDFDGLYVSVPGNNSTQAATILPSGWVFAEAGTNANTTFRNDNGSSGTGDTYLDGATSSNERALGGFASGSLTTQYGASFTNNTGTTLTQFTLSYTGEQWKDGGSGSAVFNTETFAYSIGATSLTSGTYTNVPQLDFLAVVNNTTADIILDGNNPTNQRTISFTVTGMSWADGATMFIRWTDANDAGNDDNLAIDGVTFSALSSCAAPAITSTTSNTPICEGGTLNLSVVVTGTPTPTFAWIGPNGFTSNLQNPSINNVTTAASGMYTVTATNNCGSSSYTVATMVNNSPIATITSVGNTTFCSGGSVTLTASSGSSYLWSNGETTQAIIVTTTSNYSVTVVGGNSCVTSSAPINITVNSNVTPSVSIVALPTNTICSGTSITLAATPANGGIPSYQWMLNGNPVGTNSATYSSSSFNSNDAVECTLTSNIACVTSATVNSNTVTIFVTASITPSVNIGASSSVICAGANVTFTATPINGGSTPSYQWMLNGNSVGTNSPIYYNNSLVNNDTIICVLTSSHSCALPTAANSNTITANCPITGVNQINNNYNGSIIISPNPANTSFAITLNNNSHAKANVVLTDVTGKHIASYVNANAESGTINIFNADLEPGMYFVTVNVSEHVFVSRVVINK